MVIQRMPFARGVVFAFLLMLPAMAEALPDLQGWDGRPTYPNYYFNLTETSAVWGGTIDLSFWVANFGSSSAGAFSVNIILSKNSTFGDSDDYILASGTFASGLPASNAGSLSGSIVLPSVNPWGDSTTTFYVGIFINPNHAVTESNYTNNANLGAGKDSATHTITITAPQPSISVSESTPPGNNNSISFGSVAVDGSGGAVGTQTVTITDNGPAPLTINSISTSGSVFKIANVIATSKICRCLVRFRLLL